MKAGFNNLYHETKDLLIPLTRGPVSGAISTLLQLKAQNRSHVTS